jgi:hypothetical protein
MRLDVRSQQGFRLAALFACMVVGTLLPIIAFRLIEGPAPHWSCSQSAPASAGAYLFWQEGAFLISAAALATVLLRLSKERRRAVQAYGSAPFGIGTYVALMSAAAVTAVFLAFHAAFAIYGTLLILVGVGILQLGFLGGLIALGLGSFALIRSGSPNTNMLIRSLQALGWCVLAAGLPVAFILTAPLGLGCWG